MAALFAAVSAAVPSVAGSCVPSVSHCLSNDTSSSHCLASIYNIYAVCLAEASSYSEIAQASSYSYADRALELGKSAATWQLVVALYVALLVLRMQDGSELCPSHPITHARHAFSDVAAKEGIALVLQPRHFNRLRRA